MRKIIWSALVAAVAICAMAPLAAAESKAREARIRDAVIVEATPESGADRDARQYALAARELAHYLETMSGAKVSIVPPEGATGRKVALVVGGPERNAFAADLATRHVIEPKLPSSHRDAFIVRSGKDGDTDCVVFAGANGLATLYAVYHYLEHCCDVGWFMDGEHVPQRRAIPVEGVDIAETPRFRDRHFGFSMAYGMNKYFNQFRTADEMNQLMDWMAKRKLNRTGWGFFAYPGGLESQAAFGYERKPQEDYGSGWPRAWTFAPEYRTKMLQDWFSYARDRGVQIFYALEFGLVPASFREKHPELPYVPNLGYDANVIQPDSPECLAVMKRYIDEIVRLYGTDHIYQCTPFCESTGATTPDEAFAIKLKAARSLCATLSKIDPDYVWQSDSWDFGAVGDVWTSERLTRYFEELKPLRERMYIYDTMAEANPFWNRTNCFGGTPWAFGILHSFQGDDYLHGNMPRIIQQTREAANDPASVNLKGLYHVPESFGHNVMYFQLTTALTWDPNNVDLEEFVKEYCRTRYDAASYGAMLDASRALLNAAYRGGGVDLYYQRMGITYNPPVSAPFDDYQAYQYLYPEIRREIPLMERVVEKTLSVARRERGNKLYENDLVDYVRTTLGLKSNYYLIKAYEAFKADDRAALEENAALTLKCLDGISMILSTRPDFSIKKTIDDAMAIPGTNPYVPRMIRKHAINDLYAPVENFEQLVLYSKPRVEAYFNEMRARMDRGEKGFPRASLNEAFGAFDQRWWNDDIVIPDSARFKGATMEAVRTAYALIPQGATDGAERVELKIDQVIECTPDSSSELQNSPWEDGSPVIEKLHGRNAWKLDTLPNKYLYFTNPPDVASNCKEPIVVIVQYLDQGHGQIVIEYDSYDGRYAPVAPTLLTDSGEWKTAKITLPRPQFLHSQNANGNFRFFALDGPIFISGVAIASSHTTALPTFEQVKGLAKSSSAPGEEHAK